MEKDDAFKAGCVRDVSGMLGVKSYRHWTDAQRSNPTLLARIEDARKGLERKTASVLEAETLFELILDRAGGGNLAGRHFHSILRELVNSTEYKMKQWRWRNIAQNLDSGATLDLGGHLIRLSRLPKSTCGESRAGVQISIDQGGLNACLVFPSRKNSQEAERVATILCGRFAALLDLLQRFLIMFPNKRFSRSVFISLGDGVAGERCLAFCSNRDDYLLPDSSFLGTKGYERFRKGGNRSWDERSDMAYFRGTDTGSASVPRYEHCQRIQVALLSKEHPDLINARITGVQVAGADNSLEREHFLRAKEISGKWEDQSEVFNHRYQIDVDGNTNSWPGLFIKLLSGAAVLKVQSPGNHRQWYYHRLEPWVNYVPVKADLSDLVEKIQFLKRNENLGRIVGENGRKLALSLDYVSQLEYGVLILHRALLHLD